MALTIAYYSFDDPAYACARLRVLEPARALGDAVRLIPAVVPAGPGHRVLPEVPPEADCVLVQRYFPCPQTEPVMRAIFASGRPVVYDTDDDFTAVPPDHPFFPRMAAVLPHILDTARRAALVTVSTRTLADVFAALNDRIVVLPNLLPDTLWRPVQPPTRPAVAVLMAATPSHSADLAPLVPALTTFAAAHTDTVRFVFFGCPPQLAAFPAATVIPFAANYAAYAAKLPRLGCAIGLAPLADTAFNRAKSPIKWMEYAAAGAVTMAADLPPYREAISHGETGLLVGSAPQDWTSALKRLVADAPLRHQLATRAMETVARDHLLATGVWRYNAAWSRAAGKEGP